MPTGAREVVNNAKGLRFHRARRGGGRLGTTLRFRRRLQVAHAGTAFHSRSLTGRRGPQAMNVNKA